MMSALSPCGESITVTPPADTGRDIAPREIIATKIAVVTSLLIFALRFLIQGLRVGGAAICLNRRRESAACAGHATLAKQLHFSGLWRSCHTVGSAVIPVHG